MSNTNWPETVGEDVLWSQTLFLEQKAQTDAMRSALINTDKSDPFSIRNSLQNIKALRIYHQIVRIIRYTEEMDKIEKKLYETLDRVLDNMDANEFDDEYGSTTATNLSLLMQIQSSLQKSMIDSQKLLDPYLNIKELTYIEVPANEAESNDLIAGQVIDQESRKKLREGAQEALEALTAIG